MRYFWFLLWDYTVPLLFPESLRKVLGASVTDIVQLLLWQFSEPMLLAKLIAWPMTARMIQWLGARENHGFEAMVSAVPG